MKLWSILLLLLPLHYGFSQAPGTSWAQVKKTGKGNLTVYWYESRPFIFKNSQGQLDGLEYTLANDFVHYVNSHYPVSVTINWKEGKSFADLFSVAAASSAEGLIACSAISITKERLEAVGFSPSYMSNVSVMISSKDVPLFQNESAFEKMAGQLTAITIKGTTYDGMLQAMLKERKLNFKIHYIESSDNVLDTIREMENAIGFIDLPIYLMDLQRNAGNSVKRQNIFPRKWDGYAFMIPKQSDWIEPLSEYLASQQFKKTMAEATGKYIDRDIYLFIEKLIQSSDDDLELLNKEKEIQEASLMGKDQQLHQQNVVRNFLIATVGLSITVLVSIYLLYRKSSNDNQLLNEQKSKIEAQGKSIELQNKQLELKADRLQHLNEEKNNLIKILAHDLRSPINQVQGLAQIFILENKSLPPTELEPIHKIIDASVRLNSMIGKILDVDAIETNRVNLIIEDIHVAPQVKRVISSFEKQALLKNIALEYQGESDQVTFPGDSLFFTEIMENLISNGIKFSEGNKKIKVEVRSTASDVTISVYDQGPGLTPDDFDKLFEKYQRLSARPTGGEPSTGLGLSIVKKYVALMQGKVWAETRPEGGSVFRVQFPLSKA